MKQFLSKKVLGLSFLGIFLILAILILWNDKSVAPAKSSELPTSNKTTTPEETSSQNTAKPTETKIPFNKNMYSTTDPSSIWMVVNKKHALPSSYSPTLTSVSGGQIRPEASASLSSLLKDASISSNSLYIISSYRSYSNQQSTYGAYVARDGVAQADTYSARPGYSEHQTGLALDLGNGTCNLEICFGDTNAGKWLAQNAYKYGFIIRYPNDKTNVTGYQYEPWHIRYVGIDLSTEMHVKNIETLEEFFGIKGGPNY
jgi:D-alanyl-D-alanine carboxypeptidase